MGRLGLNKSSQRPHTSAKENLVRIWSPSPESGVTQIGKILILTNKSHNFGNELSVTLRVVFQLAEIAVYSSSPFPPLCVYSSSYIIIMVCAISRPQWRRQNFSAAGAQPGHQNLDWGTVTRLCVSSLFLVEVESPHTL